MNGETLAAVAFYAGAACVVTAAIRGVRAAVERQRRDLGAAVLAAVGVVLVAASIVTFLRSGRGVLPF